MPELGNRCNNRYLRPAFVRVNASDSTHHGSLLMYDGAEAIVLRSAWMHWQGTERYKGDSYFCQRYLGSSTLCILY